MEKPAEPHVSKNGDCDAYLQRFGELMTSEEVRVVLKFNSLSALSMARRRGHIPLKPTRVEGRRTLMYSTYEVFSLVSKWAGQDEPPSLNKEGISQ